MTSDPAPRQQEVADLVCGALDPWTPMELHLLLHPDVRVAGFPSSLFFHSFARDRIEAIFGFERDLASPTSPRRLYASIAPYADDVRFFIYRASLAPFDASPNEWGLVSAADIDEAAPSHHTYLIEPQTSSAYARVVYDDVERRFSRTMRDGSSPRSCVCVNVPAYQPDEHMVELLQHLRDQGFARMVVVDDGSGPQYRSVFEAAARIPDVEVVTLSENHGYGYALKAAAAHTVANLPDRWPCVGIVQCDCDGQHAPDDVARAADLLLAYPTRLVVGQRDFSSNQVPGVRRFANNLTSKVMGRIFDIHLPDTQSGLRALPLSLASALDRVQTNHMEFTTELLLYAHKHGYETHAFPIQTIYRGEAASSHYKYIEDTARIVGVMVAGLASRS